MIIKEMVIEEIPRKARERIKGDPLTHSFKFCIVLIFGCKFCLINFLMNSQATRHDPVANTSNAGMNFF